MCAFLLISAAAEMPRSEGQITASVGEHLRDLMQEVPPGSLLHQLLERGDHGDGMHYAWMDEMRRQGVRRVLIQVDFVWRGGRRGRPTHLKVTGMTYLRSYADAREIRDKAALDSIGLVGLERTLDEEALRRAKQGFWLEAPRARLRAVTARTCVELFDDEWLPAPTHPGFFSTNPKGEPGCRVLIRPEEGHRGF